MGWIKDNLIAVLGCLCLALGLGWLITHYIAAANYSQLETRYAVATADLSNLRDANTTNLATIDQLKAANTQWERDYKAARLDARTAALRVDDLIATMQTQLEVNRKLREQLAKENPDVAAYLDDAMPCELALQLWGNQDGYCQN